jgi:hypothetical protein
VSESYDLTQVLSGKVGRKHMGAVIYLVVDRRDGVQYVGITRQSIAKRFKGRAGDGTPLGDTLATRNLSGWRLDVYDLLAAKASDEWRALLSHASTIEQAERLLIGRYQPPLNRAHTKRASKRRQVRRQAGWGPWQWIKHTWLGRRA